MGSCQAPGDGRQHLEAAISIVHSVKFHQPGEYEFRWRTASLVKNLIAGVPASLPMITNGGLEAVLRSLASEYAKEHIRFNAVAPGVVVTPLRAGNPKDFLKTLSPVGSISTVEEIASVVVYLTEARQITGKVLHVDGGAHRGKW